MTSNEIRQSFLDFFKSKGHTIVPSSSLLPDSPNLLFTNAGMNQFVPIFLGQQKAPFSPPRAADTQKCIRAGGKHNDLEDVGLDTYHHTFFEMLGNWSFGDYFKKEAIEWAWELVTEVWKFPKNRLYATVYKPGPGDPSEFDQEAYDHWAKLFTSAGLDPKVHIVNGNKKDNFWMMGETGPCGPCSELHVDLTPDGDTRGSLVNKGDARCIEIWNLVFIQFNANQDGTFSPLPARHVDTGMGFERVTSIIQGTKDFKDFRDAKISNYETDVFRPIFDALEKLSGKKYTSTLPAGDTSRWSEQQKIDVAFRVIADHIRTLSFAIADGIRPGNTDRHYVLRRILRRAVRYGRTLGFHEPFFYKLVDVLAETMGRVFPEVVSRKDSVQETIRIEEEAFNKTLDRGLQLFDDHWWRLTSDLVQMKTVGKGYRTIYKNYESAEVGATRTLDLNSEAPSKLRQLGIEHPPIGAGFAFELYDTYGFPLDLTELMARERGLAVDTAGFEKLMEEQRRRARAAQKKQVVEVDPHGYQPTRFVGFETFESESSLLGLITKLNAPGKVPDYFAVADVSPLYAEAGGQVGDSGKLYWQRMNEELDVIDTQRRGDVFYLKLKPGRPFELEQLGMLAVEDGEPVRLSVEKPRRAAIQRHHTVTHLLHWALHEVVSKEAAQKGSYVGPEKLTFDFNSAALTPAQVRDIETLVNERIVEGAPVSWVNVPYSEVKGRKEIMQFFGEKYGDEVRVVQIGGKPQALDGYSMELCGGTHTRNTGEIGLFRIVAESAIASGVRRIEAVAGLRAYEKMREEMELLISVASKVNSPVGELEKKIDSLLAQQKELEKQLKSLQQKQAAESARGLIAKAQTFGPVRAIIENLGTADGDYLQGVADALKGEFKGVIVLGGVAAGAVSLVAAVSPDFTAKVQAGKVIQAIAPIVGGKGGGRPDNARGGGRDASKLNEALTKASEILKTL